jgi:hypothetical protein
MNEAIGRTIGAILVALLLPVVFIVFALVCVAAIVRTMTEKQPNDPEYWE